MIFFILIILEYFSIWLVSVTMFAYGIGKPLQFYEFKNYKKTIDSLTGKELMWSFYAYSSVYPLLIGGLEVLGAILLIFKRTRILGAILLSILLLNIIIQDIIYSVDLGALITALYLQIFILVICFFNKEKIIQISKILFSKDRTENNNNNNNNNKYVIIGFILFLVFKLIEYKI